MVAQFVLIIFLVSGSSNLVWEITGQMPLDQCQALATQRMAVARAANPGVTVVGGCYQMVKA